jgi:hypothetical protein
MGSAHYHAGASVPHRIRPAHMGGCDCTHPGPGAMLRALTTDLNSLLKEIET